jgi:formate dehydrogenase subunit delta
MNDRGSNDHGPQGGPGHGGAEHLVQMANDIGNFFRSEPKREDAITGIADHISRSWTPRMREKLIAHLEHGDEGLDELPREALRRLVAAAKPRGSAPAAND